MLTYSDQTREWAGCPSYAKSIRIMLGSRMTRLQLLTVKSQKPLISKASSRGCAPGYSIKEGSGQACPSCTTCYSPMYRVAKLAVLRSQQVEWAKCRGGCVEYKIWDWVSLPVIPHSFVIYRPFVRHHATNCIAGWFAGHCTRGVWPLLDILMGREARSVRDSLKYHGKRRGFDSINVVESPTICSAEAGSAREGCVHW